MYNNLTYQQKQVFKDVKKALFRNIFKTNSVREGVSQGLDQLLGHSSLSVLERDYLQNIINSCRSSQAKININWENLLKQTQPSELIASISRYIFSLQQSLSGQDYIHVISLALEEGFYLKPIYQELINYEIKNHTGTQQETQALVELQQVLQYRPDYLPPKYKNNKLVTYLWCNVATLGNLNTQQHVDIPPFIVNSYNYNIFQGEMIQKLTYDQKALLPISIQKVHGYAVLREQNIINSVCTAVANYSNKVAAANQDPSIAFKTFVELSDTMHRGEFAPWHQDQIYGLYNDIVEKFNTVYLPKLIVESNSLQSLESAWHKILDKDLSQANSTASYFRQQMLSLLDMYTNHMNLARFYNNRVLSKPKVYTLASRYDYVKERYSQNPDCTPCGALLKAIVDKAYKPYKDLMHSLGDSSPRRVVFASVNQQLRSDYQGLENSSLFRYLSKKLSNKHQELRDWQEVIINEELENAQAKAEDDLKDNQTKAGYQYYKPEEMPNVKQPNILRGQPLNQTFTAMFMSNRKVPVRAQLEDIRQRVASRAKILAAEKKTPGFSKPPIVLNYPSKARKPKGKVPPKAPVLKPATPDNQNFSHFVLSNADKFELDNKRLLRPRRTHQ